MDEFTNHIEELNSKLSQKKSSPSQQNIALQAELCNGSDPTSYFIPRVGNGSVMQNSSSSSQLAKESPVLDEVLMSNFVFCTLHIHLEVSHIYIYIFSN